MQQIFLKLIHVIPQLGPTSWHLFPGCQERFVPRKSHISIIRPFFHHRHLHQFGNINSVTKSCILASSAESSGKAHFHHCHFRQFWNIFQFRHEETVFSLTLTSGFSLIKFEKRMNLKWEGVDLDLLRQSAGRAGHSGHDVWFGFGKLINLQKTFQKWGKRVGNERELIWICWGRRARRAGHSGHGVWLILDTLSHDLLTLSQYV